MKTAEHRLLTIALVAPLALAAPGCRTMFVDPDEAAGEAAGEAEATDYLATGKTQSFFSAVQVDPPSEDSAGPQLVRAADIDGDGMTDLASAWNQSQPVQVHLQRRDADGEVFFETVTIAGTTPIARVSGLEIADMDLDGRLDIVVLIKDTGMIAICDVELPDCDLTDNGGIVKDALWGGLLIFFAPEDRATETWEPNILVKSFFAGTEGNTPEEGGYTSLTIGDLDGRDGVDLVVAFNSAEKDPQLDLKLNRIDVYLNPGSARARLEDAWDNTTVFADLPEAKFVVHHGFPGKAARILRKK